MTPPKVTKNVRLPADLARALDTYAAMRGEALSAVVERLVRELLAGEDLAGDARKIERKVER